MRTVDPVKHAARRAHIRDAAAGVFAERGYDGATTAQICKAAGVGSGTLFHYFGDKRSIMVSIFEQDHGSNDAVITSLEGGSPMARVSALLEHLTRDVVHPIAPGLVVALLQLATRDLAFAELLDSGDSRVRSALAEWLGEAVELGEIGDHVHPARAARWVLTLVDSLFLMSGDDGVDPAVERDELFVLVRRYLGA